MPLSRITNPFLSSSGAGNASITSPAANTLAFTTTTTERMRIDSSGNVGIGTTTPDIFSRGYGTTLGVSNTGAQGTSIAVNSGTSTYPAFELGRGGVRKAFFTAQSTVTEFGNLEAVPLAFFTNSTERARFNSTGALVFAGGTTTADGIGITFPATQSASTNANTLDDYEEGTFTPTIKFGNNSAGQTYGTRSATYVKVGQMVLIQMSLSFSNKGSSTGTATITGMPFNQNNTAYAMGPFAADGGFSSIPSNGFGIYGLIAGDVVYLRFNNSSGGYTDLLDSQFTNSSAMYYSVVYRASA